MACTASPASRPIAHGGPRPAADPAPSGSRLLVGAAPRLASAALLAILAFLASSTAAQAITVTDRTGLDSPELVDLIGRRIAQRWPSAQVVTIDELDAQFRGQREADLTHRLRPRGLSPVVDTPVILWLRLSVTLPGLNRPIRLFGRTLVDPAYDQASAIAIARRPWSGDLVGQAPRDPWEPIVREALENAIALAPRVR